MRHALILFFHVLSNFLAQKQVRIYIFIYLFIIYIYIQSLELLESKNDFAFHTDQKLKANKSISFMIIILLSNDKGES